MYIWDFLENCSFEFLEWWRCGVVRCVLETALEMEKSRTWMVGIWHWLIALCFYLVERIAPHIDQIHYLRVFLLPIVAAPTDTKIAVFVDYYVEALVSPCVVPHPLSDCVGDDHKAPVLHTWQSTHGTNLPQK